jgi:hypothetical protein
MMKTSPPTAGEDTAPTAISMLMRATPRTGPFDLPSVSRTG